MYNVHVIPTSQPVKVEAESVELNANIRNGIINERFFYRVMSVPIELLKKLESEASPDLKFILNQINLIDAYLNINQSTEMVSLNL